MMTIDEMEVGRTYTIRYGEGSGVKPFDGCRFEGIMTWQFIGNDDETRSAVVYLANTTPSATLFREPFIVGIEPE